MSIFPPKPSKLRVIQVKTRPGTPALLNPPTPSEVKLLRTSFKLSQAAFAAKVGVSTRTVEEWEAGRRQPPAMLRWVFAGMKADIEPYGITPNEGRITRAAD